MKRQLTPLQECTDLYRSRVRAVQQKVPENHHTVQTQSCAFVLSSEKYHFQSKYSILQFSITVCLQACRVVAGKRVVVPALAAEKSCCLELHCPSEPCVFNVRSGPLCSPHVVTSCVHCYQMRRAISRRIPCVGTVCGCGPGECVE